MPTSYALQYTALAYLSYSGYFQTTLKLINAHSDAFGECSDASESIC